MTENKILKLEFSVQSEAAGKLTEQQSECLDHEIQINPQPTESYEIQWNLSLRKPQGHRCLSVGRVARRRRGRGLARRISGGGSSNG
jgi:hypothetical protein